jgi:hypothetical protein
MIAVFLGESGKRESRKQRWSAPSSLLLSCFPDSSSLPVRKTARVLALAGFCSSAFVSSALAAINAAPTTPAPAEIKDIVGPVDVWPYPMWMMVTAAGIALVVLGLLTWLLVRWLRRRSEPPPLPRDVALRELERLRPQVQTADPYAFSFPVSDVLRTYIGAQYSLHAREQTSPEFLASISTSPKFSDADRSLLAEFLEHCDMIKFARIDATAEDSARLLESAIAFVQGGGA